MKKLTYQTEYVTIERGVYCIKEIHITTSYYDDGSMEERRALGKIHFIEPLRY